MIGRRLSHYTLVAPLGSGGMGDVYRARDDHLERDVAIKVLPPGALGDDSARKRFRREALALSRLAHPHINVIHDFDHDGDVDFLVLELIQGETLEDRLRKGRRPEPEVVRLGAQIASALAAAHEQGVIHRDLKPSNIMITPRGDAKVLDFGIAKRLPQADGRTVTQTESFAVVGTMPYMAPEQVLGEPADARTDGFALGTLLYEMATGRRPFAGDNAVTLAHAIINEAPTPPRVVNPELSAHLEAVILRCLEKNPDRRFNSASEIADALGGSALPAHASPAPRRERDHRKKLSRRASWVLGASLLVVLGAMVVTLAQLRSGRAVEAQTLAVLPFQNLSNDPDQQFFVDGMTDELIVTLSQIRGIRVIARSSSMVFANSDEPIPEIAKRLKASAVVTGSVQRSENRVRLRAQLVHAKSAQTMWGDSFERDVGEVFALQGDLARQVVEQVQGRLDPRDRERLAAAPRVDPVVHEHYLRGRFFWNQFSGEGWQRALSEFQQAIDRDPTFALAYVGLSDTYALMSANVLKVTEAMPRARAAAVRALELAPELPSALASMAYVQCSYDHDWTNAEANLRRALEINPNEITALQNYGLLLHVNGRFDEALEMFGRAREIDPLSPYVVTMSLWPLNQGRRHDEAIAQAREILAADSTSFFPRLILAQSLGFSGRQAEAVPEFERIVRMEGLPILKGWLGWAYAGAGRRAEAQAILDELMARSRSEVVQPYAFALVEVGLGLQDEALASLARGVDEHGDENMFIKVDPVWDPLRSDPRFGQLLERLHLN